MRKKTILLIEDNDDDALFLKLALERAKVDFPMHVAQDGQAALDYLGSVLKPGKGGQVLRPLLVLLDLKLPKVMGFEVLEWLRRHREFDSTPVIVCSASQNPADVERAYRLRANAYLVKPSNLAKLDAQIQALVCFWLEQNHGAGQ